MKRIGDLIVGIIVGSSLGAFLFRTKKGKQLQAKMSKRAQRVLRDVKQAVKEKVPFEVVSTKRKAPKKKKALTKSR